MGQCLFAFMCGEVQGVGESHFSQVLWRDIKCVFSVGCSVSRPRQFEEQVVTFLAQLPIPTRGSHETLNDPKEDAAALDRV